MPLLLLPRRIDERMQALLGFPSMNQADPDPERPNRTAGVCGMNASREEDDYSLRTGFVPTPILFKFLNTQRRPVHS